MISPTPPEGHPVRRGAPLAGLIHRPAKAVAATADATVAIRFGRPCDEEAVAAIEEMDGKALAPGDRLIAEIDGRVVAVLGVADGVAAADPFVHTEAAVELLRMRAEQLRLVARPRVAFRLFTAIRPGVAR